MGPASSPADVAALLAERPWIERLARGLVQDPALADDLAQEAWLVAARRGPRDARALRPFLRGVLVHLRSTFRRTEVRRALREAAAAAPEALPSADELVGRAELQRLLVESVLSLAEPERSAILLRYFEGLTAEEIAARAGVPAATIRSRAQRGLARLRERLEARADRVELLAGLVLLAHRAPPLAGSPALPAAAGPALSTLAGTIAMKTPLLAGAAGLAALSLAAGWWLLERPGSSTRAGEAPVAPELAHGAALPAPARAPEAEPVEPGERVALPGPAAESAPGASPLVPAGHAAPRADARVVDEAGLPVAGAVVREGEDELGTSDASGAFAVELAPVEQETTIPVVVVHPSFAKKTVYARVAPDALVHLGTLQLVPAGTIEGWVEDASGRHVAGAQVRVTGLETPRGDPETLRRQGPEQGEATIEVASELDGRFLATGVPAGAARAWAGAEGFAWSSAGPLEIRAGETLRDVRIVLGDLRASDRIAGVVLDPDGKPVPHAHVRTWFTSALLGRGRDLEADDEGRFDWLLEARVAHDLTFSDPGNRWSPEYVLHVEPGTLDLVVQFHEPRWIDVAVVDDQERPLEGFALETEDRDSGLYLDMQARVEPAGTGTARLRVPNLPFVVVASLRGHAREEQGPLDPVRLPAELRFVLAPLPGIHGVVRGDGGAPVAGARVGLRRPVAASILMTSNGFRTLVEPYDQDGATTDDEGRFTLYPERAADYVVEAEAAGYALAALAPRAFEPRQAAELELELLHGGALEGRVLAPSGLDPTGFVLAYHRADGRVRTLRLGPAGTYRIDGLTPGAWELRPMTEELAGNRSGSSSTLFVDHDAPPWGSSCEVRDGETTVHDVDLSEFAPCTLDGSFTLEGRALDGWTAALEHAYTLESTEEGTVASVALGADGRFALVAPRAGSYRLVLRGPGEPYGRLELQDAVELAPEAATGWRFVLRPGRLEGSGALGRGTRESFYLYAASAEGDGRRLSASLRIVPDEQGRFVLPTVPAGRGKISRNDPPAEGQAFAPWETVSEFDVPAGGVERIVLPE